MADTKNIMTTKASDATIVSSPFGVLTGKIEDTPFDEIVFILAEEMGLKDKTLTEMREFMKSEDLAVIYNKISKEVYTDTEKRNCNRFTFTKETVSKLERIVLPFILESMGQKADDVKLHPDHGDVLYYPVGGQFKWHCDEVLKCPFEGKWAFNSLILCLDASGDTGSTVVRISSELHRQDIYYGLDRGIEDDTTERYYRESIIPQNFLVFPADVPHKSMPIIKNWTSTDPFKMVLKLDVWYKIPEKFDDEAEMYDDSYDDYYDYRDEQEEDDDPYNGYGSLLDECNGYERAFGRHH